MSANTAKPDSPIKHKRRHFSWDDLELTLLALPTTIWYILFSYIPMFGIIIAFKKFKPVPGASFMTSLLQSDWVGLKNFRFLFMTSDSFIMIRNTILYNLTFLILGLFVSVTLAILISMMRSAKLAKVLQTAMFLPHFLSWVVVSYFLFAFLSYDKGLVNKIFLTLGKEPTQWYTAIKVWPGLLVGLNLWKGTGYSMVVYLASIAGIDGTYYEAAIIDGASKWQQVVNITLPLLRPIIAILMIMSIGRMMSSDFGLFYQATRNSGEIIDVRQTIDTYVYDALTVKNNIGFSSAAAAFQSIVGLILISSANLLVKKIDADSSLF